MSSGDLTAEWRRWTEPGAVSVDKMLQTGDMMADRIDALETAARAVVAACETASLAYDYWTPAAMKDATDAFLARYTSAMDALRAVLDG